MAEAAAKRRSQAAVAGLFLDKVLGRWLIVLVIAVVSLILGYIGLNEYLSHNPASGFGRGWTDILFYDLQLFVLNAAPAEGAGPFPVTLTGSQQVEIRAQAAGSAAAIYHAMIMVTPVTSIVGGIKVGVIEILYAKD